eukprot:scaffold110825_cov102-Attheya_sp.AAC.1
MIAGSSICYPLSADDVLYLLAISSLRKRCNQVSIGNIWSQHVGYITTNNSMKRIQLDRYIRHLQLPVVGKCIVDGPHYTNG